MQSWLKCALAVGLFLLLCGGTAANASAQGSITVQAGDNLYRIALRHGTSVSALMQANGLSSPDRIYAGQRLVLPSTGGVARPPATVPGDASAPAGRHVVAAGETLSRIAVRYGTTVGVLMRANNLLAPNRIFAGQSLVVPERGGAADPAGTGGAPAPADGGPGRRIVVDLSEQRLYAYEGNVTAQTFTVSTGKASTPTPVGTYRIYARYAAQTMVGPGYYLPGVPYVQYFVGNYALHGTYWHNSFGTPVTHGCVNLTPGNASWLWQWASAGTPVTVRW